MFPLLAPKTGFDQILLAFFCPKIAIFFGGGEGWGLVSEKFPEPGDVLTVAYIYGNLYSTSSFIPRSGGGGGSRDGERV